MEPADPQIRGEMLTPLGAAHESYETRLFQMTQGTPALVWDMLVLFAAAAGFSRGGIDLKGCFRRVFHVFACPGTPDRSRARFSVRAHCSCLPVTSTRTTPLQYPRQRLNLPSDFDERTPEVRRSLETYARDAAATGQ
jgi:hypothetical protein